MAIVTVEVNKIFGIYGTFPTQGLQSHKVYTNFKRIILCKMCQYSVHHANVNHARQVEKERENTVSMKDFATVYHSGQSRGILDCHDPGCNAHGHQLLEE